MQPARELSIGQLSARTGVAVSALRYYEAEGLIRSERTSGGQRRFQRTEVRRVSFILIAQSLGLSLDRIGGELSELPTDRPPTREEWARIAEGIRGELDARIASLTRTRDRLDGCIGCGCLSLEACALYNPEDRAARRGAGPRYAMGDDPEG